MLLGRDFHVAHGLPESSETTTGESAAAPDESAFLILVLLASLEVDPLGAKLDHKGVLEKELGEIHLLVTLVALLVKVDCPDTVLGVLEVGRDVDHVVVASHVAEEAGEGALVELDELLSHACEVGLVALEVISNEDIPRNTSNVFLDQRVSIDEVVDSIRGENVFELEAIDSRGIRNLHVKVIVVIVVLIHDTDAEGP